MFKIGDILVCIEEEDSVYIEVGEEVILRNFYESGELDMLVGYIDYNEGTQYASSKNFILKGEN